MRSIFVFALVLGLLAVGCVQAPPGPPDNNTTGTPPANNTTGIPPDYLVKEYCRIDEDCVRLNKCCDCGLGEYVNIYNQENPECTGPQCKCAIAISRGECHDNRCVAVAYSGEHPPQAEEGIALDFSDGACGYEIAPRKQVTQEGMVISGSIGVPNPCRKVMWNVSKSAELWKIMLTTESPDGGNCVECIGAIPWSANISGFYERVEVYYDGRMVFPDLASFCGTSTQGGCTSGMDCMRGGCSGQICQSKFEEPLITTCEWRDCYEDEDVGISCGCIDGKCQWQ